MPKLMEREEWTTALESARRSNRVWRQRVVGSGGEVILALPEAGSFEVIFVEIPTPVESLFLYANNIANRTIKGYSGRYDDITFIFVGASDHRRFL